MNLVILCLAIYTFHGYQAGAEVEFYPDFRRPDRSQAASPDSDVAQEDYVIEDLARQLFSQEAAQDDPEQTFSFRFPAERPLATAEQHPFAVRPSDPRYYQQDPPLEPADAPQESGDHPQLPSASVKPLYAADTHDAIRLGNRAPPQPQSQSRNMVYRTPVHANDDDQSDVYFVAIVAGCSAAAVAGVIGIGIGWYKLHKSTKAAADVEYPAYGVTGPKETSPTGDRRLAQSAHMYHYQHQKQQIIAMENRATNERNGSLSEPESEEENEEGDYTVYECPGLAPTGEMEVKNPLFQDDPTPATPAPNKDVSGSSPAGGK